MSVPTPVMRRCCDAVLKLRDLVGEFEKPKFFQYKQKLCAHSRNEQIGCTACIDVCSAQAIRSDASLKGRARRRPAAQTAGGIVVEPHLCVGCGACTTVCPSGAISYATPRAAEQGQRMRTLVVDLSARRRQGSGAAAAQPRGRRCGHQANSAGPRAPMRRVRGVPLRVLPLELWHTASVGIELWLSAIAYGASQVWVLMTDEEAPEYRVAVQAQIEVAQTLAARLRLQRRAPAHRQRAPTPPRSTRHCAAHRPSRWRAPRPSASRPTSARRSTW